MSYFIFNDINSYDMGLIVNKLPAREVPAEKKEIIEIAGRDGYVTFKENAYAPIIFQIECTAKESTSIYSLANVLKGRGKLILSTDPDIYYEAEVINGIPFEKIIGLWKKFIIQFECQPYLKSNEIKINTLITGDNAVVVEGTGKIHPTIELVGNGTFKITINDNIINLIGINPNIKIDTELMNATSIDGLLNLNNKMEGQFITLKQGTNSIKIEVISGTLTSRIIKYQEAWL